MAGIYSQVYVQVILAVKKREHLIPKGNREELFDHIADIIRKNGQKPIIVNGFASHVHAFLGITPEVTISNLVRIMKTGSAGFINRKQWVKPKFSWQPGFGVFSYSHSQVECVFKYLRNQENFHGKTTFRDEFREFLKRFTVEFREDQLFDWIDGD